MEQRDIIPSGLLAGKLTDEERSEDQQSRELHCGLLRGRSAGDGGVRSVVIHVTMHEVYTCRHLQIHMIFKTTSLALYIEYKPTNLRALEPGKRLVHQSCNRFRTVCSWQIPINLKPFPSQQPANTPIAVSMTLHIKLCRSRKHRKCRCNCIPVVDSLQCQNFPLSINLLQPRNESSI